MKRSNRTLFSAILTLWLVACATATRVPTLPSNYEIGVSENPIVIGRVSIFLTKGKPMKQSGLFGEHIARMVTIKNDATGKTFEFDSNQDGSDSHFYISIPPGQYSITKVKAGTLEANPSGKFQVDKGQVVYIGTLKFEGTGLGKAIGLSMLHARSTFPGKWVVKNDYPAAVKSFRKKYPKITQEVIKSLIYRTNIEVK